MLHDPHPSVIVDRARREALAAPDVWAKAVLDICKTQGYTPDARLCLARPGASSSVSGSMCGSADGGAECSPHGASSETKLGTATTREGGEGTAAVALDLPPELLANAYRLDAPCLMKHAAASDTTMTNCPASPRCLVGLQALRSTKAAMKECVDYCMGPGPVVLPMPATGAAAEGEPEARSDSAEVAAESTERAAPSTIADDFPCLWRGLRNLGNTCYFNAVMQLLFAIPGVRRAILADGTPLDGVAPEAAPVIAPAASPAEALPSNTITNSTSSNTHSDGQPTAADTTAAGPTPLSQSGLKEVFAQMAFSRAGAGADPSSFAQYLSLDPAVQQDAQEYLALLLDWLRCHCGADVRRAVDAAFGGTLLYDRRCGSCERPAKRAEPFLYLSVPVKATLQDSLADFVKPESVEGFACEGCGQRVTATSRQYLRNLPEVLLVHLNRFQFDVRTLQRQKILAATNIPLTLDMTPYAAQWSQAKQQEQQHGERASEGASAGGNSIISTPTGPNVHADSAAPPSHTYELRGVVSHLGDSATSGHYTYQGKVLHRAAGARLRGVHRPCRGGEEPSAGAAGNGVTPANGGEQEVCWLEFNDAEVTPCNRFKGSSSLSKDAYVLVYHRLPVEDGPAGTTRARAASPAPAPVSSTASIMTTTTAMARNPPPVPAEFPPYLRAYAARVNEHAVWERQAWEQRKRGLRTVLDQWAAAASAVFDPAPLARADLTSALASGPRRVGDDRDLFYTLPTAWLRFFGRGFLGAYVNVEAFGEDAAAASARKRAKEDRCREGGEALSGCGSTLADHDAALAAAERGGEHLPRPGSLGTLPTDPSEESRPLSPLVEVGRPVDMDGAAYYLAVHRQRLSGFLGDITCPHGRLAPWGAYKLVSRAAFARVQSFLAACEAAAGLADTGALTLDGVSFELPRGRCAPCAAAMAMEVYHLSLASRADAIALLGIHGVSVTSVTAPVRPAVDPTHSALSASVSCPASEASPPAREDELVYLDEEVARQWELYVGTRAVWQGVAKTAGYTGVFTMALNELPPPAGLPRTLPTDAAAEGGGAATSPTPPPSSPNSGAAAVITGAVVGTPQHVHLKKLAAAMQTALEVVAEEEEEEEKARRARGLHSAGAAEAPTSGRTPDVMDADANGEDGHEDVVVTGRRGPDMRVRLLCPHGSLKPEAAVRVVPESLRQYLLRRLPVVMGRAGLLSPLPALQGADNVPVTAITLPSCTEAVPKVAEGIADRPEAAQLLPSLLERVLLPYLPCAGLHKCRECVDSRTTRLASQHEVRMARVAERKRFPTLWAAGRLTSREVVAAALMAAAGAESEEQMIISQHPNRAFFKRSADREWRESVRVWQERQTARLARQEAAVADLRARAQRQRESDAAWRAMTASGKRRGPPGRDAGPSSPLDPRHPTRQLALAEACLAGMRAEEPPVVEVAYGCLPTWWVARWYRHVSRTVEAPVGLDGRGRGGGLSATPADGARLELTAEEDDLSSALASVSYGSFLCPHGKLLLELHWLNPGDAFWQGMRLKRAEALWGGRGGGSVDREGGGGGGCGGADAAFQPEDLRWSSWLPPLLIVPRDEFIAVLEQYGTPAMLEVATVAASSAGAEVEPTAGLADTGDEPTVSGADGASPTAAAAAAVPGAPAADPPAAAAEGAAGARPPHSLRVPSSTATIQLVERNGERHIVPGVCEECTRSLVSRFEDNCAYFTNGSLKLQLHLRKSKKLFYDASCVLSGTALADMAAETAAGAVGIHYYTTLRELRGLLCEYIAGAHGLLVVGEKLEILRSRKPLRRRHRPAAAGGESAPSPPAPERVPSPTAGKAGGGGGGGAESLEDATLLELGVHDGDTLNVNLMDATATPCTKARRRGAPGDDVEEEWEAIPPELLVEGGAVGTTTEHTTTFADTRLQGGAGVVPAAPAGPAEDAGVSCPVCTFLNAPGMVACEMCESPLPHTPARRRR